MDEKNPQCSQDVEPEKDDVSTVQTNQTLSEKETTETKPQTVLIKEHPVFSENLSTPKNQLIYMTELPGNSIEQPGISTQKSTFSNILITATKHESSALEEDITLPIIHIAENESSTPKEPTIDQPDISNQISTFPSHKITSTKHESSAIEEDITLPIIHIAVDESSTPKETTTTEIHIDEEKDKSSLLEEHTTLPMILIDSAVVESSSSREVNTEIYTDTAKAESSLTEEQTTLPVFLINPALDEASSSKEINTETYIDSAKAESTSSGEQANAQKKQISTNRDESSAPKNQVFTSQGQYSRRRSPNNVGSDNSLTGKAAAATTTNKCYFVNSNAPLKINSSTQSPVEIQPVLQLPIPTSVAVETEPASLFLQALAKLNDSSLTLSVVSHFRLHSSSNMSRGYTIQSGDITPPDSLSSAPPTYSFVLRQMAVRRRPRFMGTFIPSPSFVQQTPPPTYTGAYDVYIEPAGPPPPPRVYTFGFTSMPIVCPECGFTGMTAVTSHVTICTHLCAFVLCLLCCWICAPLPYILRSCKDVYHYCRNCRSFLGMYCPTNPENVYPNV